MEKKVDLFSLVLTIMLHVLLLLVLWLVVLRSPLQLEESGVPVLLGNMGNLETDYRFTEIESVPAPSAQQEPVYNDIEAPPIITQDDEESITITSGQENAIKKEIVEEVRQPTQAEIMAEAEEKASNEAQRLMSNIFANGQTSASVTDIDTEKQGIPGSTVGNSSEGKASEVGGYGSFDLNGRSIEGDGLPRPVYNVQDEGSVVVTITVDPGGNVIATSINKRTNTINTALRAAAEEAARKTKFNAIEGVNNQTGTIIYYFKLR